MDCTTTKTGAVRNNGLADCGVIQPLRSNDHILKWVIDGVENAVGADLHHDFGECLRAEIADRGDVEVLSQMVGDGKLGSRFGAQCSQYPVFNAPNIAGESFSEVTEDDLEF